MSKKPDTVNCFTFDAVTGVLTERIQLEKHQSLKILQLGIEEHNGEKRAVKACAQNPPNDLDHENLSLRSGQLKNGHIVDVEDPDRILLHIVGARKIKPHKKSQQHVIVHGSRKALIQIPSGHSVMVHNCEHKWNLSLVGHSLSVDKIAI